MKIYAHRGAARWVAWEKGFVRILPMPIIIFLEK
jgi:hypothetical protein